MNTKVNKKMLIFGTACLIIFGLIHLKDTKAGALASGDLWLVSVYKIFFLAILVIAVLGGIFILVKQNMKLESIWLFCGISMGIMYMFILPPLSAPDEISHYLSSYKISSTLLHSRVCDEEGKVLVRSQDAWIENVENSDTEKKVLGQTLKHETYKTIWEKLKSGDQNAEEGFVTSPNVTVVTTPMAYLAQATGIGIARLTGMPSIWLLFMGRFFNMLLLVCLIWLALRRIPFGKEVLLAAALLPMTLHLSASMSYDVMIIGMLFLFTAICLDLAYQKEKVTVKDVLSLALIMGIAGPCKMVYAIFMGLCLLIPIKKFGGVKKWLISACVVFAFFAIAMYLVNRQVIQSYATETEGYVAWAEETGFSLTQLLHQPGLLFKMIYNTILWQAEHYHMTMIGAWLGNIDEILDIPYLVVILFSGCLLVTALRKPGEEVIVKGGKRIWIMVLCAGCTGALMLSMLIAWTPVTSPVITGVQGRYFLPFLPMILICCKNDLVVMTENVNRKALYLMLIANCYSLLRLFSIVSLRL